MSDTPTPIDPADIRPGDVFQVVYTGTCEEIESAHSVIRTTEGDAFDMEDTDGTWHLVYRPDPDAEAVEAIDVATAREVHRRKTKREWAADTLAALREQGWDVVRRAES